MSPVVRQLGFTESPLPLAKLLRLQETIRSTLGQATPKRLNLPPAIVSCGLCRKALFLPACDVMKKLKRGSQAIYCSLQCSGIGGAKRLGRLGTKCIQCSSVCPNGRRLCSLACREDYYQKKKLKTLQGRKPVVCRQCAKVFKPKTGSTRPVYCGRSCANSAHSARMIGENNPGWRDGMSSIRYKPYIVRAFKEVRPKILNRDGMECVQCDSRKQLQVHHINLNPSDNRWSNLVTLCVRCHMKLHGTERTTSRAILWPWLSRYASQPWSGTFKWKELKTSLRTES